MTPLQLGLPGGPELLVILMVLLFVGLPTLLVLVLASRERDGDEDRIEELESRVEELESELEEERAD